MEDYSKVFAQEYAQIPISDKTVTTELSGDFILPDYQPEIKRLLKISASVLPPSKYIGDSQAEFAGNIDYYVYYTGSDNEVYCAPLTGEYKIDVPIERGSEWSLSNMTGNAEVQTDMISGRVTSPRKLNVKCRLKTQVRLFGDIPTSRDFEGNEGDNEVLRGMTNSTRMLFTAGEMLRLSDEMIIDSRDGEVRVICADGRALISEVSCNEGAVNCRGDVYLKIMMMREGGDQPYTTQRKLPFSQTLQVDGAQGRCQATARATVCELSLDVEDNRILIDVGMLIDATVNKSERVNYIKDVYSTVYKTDCQYRAIRLPWSSAVLNANFTLSDSVSLADTSISPEGSVLDCSGIATVESVTYDDNGRMTVTGKARFTLLLDKDNEYSSADVELPFKYSVDTAIKNGERTMSTVTPCVISSRARIDGERIGIDAEIGLAGNVLEMKDINVLDGVSFGDKIERSRGEYVICYPTKDDSLWSVAKRYGAPVSSLSQINHISEEHPYDSTDSLEGINYLVV
ncbi:MAG: DUF3794 domain-containing protein [Ruminococcaceae bacterium]|nr:DUF3794 domain-containing protein [Oscillospiraceae bacterium]